MKTTILIKILTSASYFFAGILLKKLLMTYPFYRVIFFRSLFSITILLAVMILTYAYSPMQLNEFKSTDYSNWFFAILLSVFSFGGLFFYSRSMQIGRYSFAASLTGIATVISIVFSSFVLGSNISISSCVVLGLLTVALTAHQYSSLKQRIISREVLYVVFYNILWGICFAVTVFPVRQLGVIVYSVILEGTVFICSAVYMFLRDRMFDFTLVLGQIKYFVVAGLLIALGNIASSYSFKELPIYTNITIGLFFEAIVILFGIVFFRERLTLKDILLIGLVTASSMFIMFF